MKTNTISVEPLDAEELDELSSFLISPVTPAGCMNIEGVDGFFTALICSPIVLLPAQWLPVLWGTDRSDDDYEVMFRSKAESGRIFSLLTKHWSYIESRLKSNELPEPILFDHSGRSEVRDAQHWSQGFLMAINMGLSEWSLFIDNPESNRYCIPILSLASGRDPDNLDMPLSSDHRTAFIEMLPPAVLEIYNFWRSNQNAWRVRTVDIASQVRVASGGASSLH